MRGLLIAGVAALAMAGQALAGEWKKLLEPADLAALTAVEELVIVDIRPAKHYERGSIEGALNAPYGSWRGPKKNPGQVLGDAELTERMQSLGLDRADKVVVVYHGASDTDFGAAARVYWTLKSAGLSEIAILNGGLVSWVRSGQALSTKLGTPERSDETFSLAADWMITRDEVRAVVDGQSEAQIIDARPLDFLKGKRKHPAAKTAGTLKGADNVVQSTWFDKDNPRQVRSAEDVLRLAREAGVEDGAARPIASFCNTGHWAATNWFALSELAGIDNVKLYPESLVGWTNADQPVVTKE